MEQWIHPSSQSAVDIQAQTPVLTPCDGSMRYQKAAMPGNQKRMEGMDDIPCNPVNCKEKLPVGRTTQNPVAPMPFPSGTRLPCDPVSALLVT